MTSPLDNLSKKEKELIGNFYKTESYNALRKLIDLERTMLAESHVNQIDILQVRYLSGQAESLKKLVNTIHLLSKATKDS